MSNYTIPARNGKSLSGFDAPLPGVRGMNSFSAIRIRMEPADAAKNPSGPYQLDTLNSAFCPLAARCRAVESSSESDGLRVRGRSAGFQRSNRQPLLGILKFRVAWTIFAPQMRRYRTIRAHGMITELTVGD